MVSLLAISSKPVLHKKDQFSRAHGRSLVSRLARLFVYKKKGKELKCYCRAVLAVRCPEASAARCPINM